MNEGDLIDVQEVYYTCRYEGDFTIIDNDRYSTKLDSVYDNGFLHIIAIVFQFILSLWSHNIPGSNCYYGIYSNIILPGILYITILL